MSQSSVSRGSEVRAAAENRPLPKNIQELLDDAVAACGETPAIVLPDEGISFTYRQLGDLVAMAAAGLNSLGLGKGARIALMLPNGIHYPVAWLACARLGSIAVPLNNNYKSREVEYVLSDSQADALIIHADYLERLESVSPDALPPKDRIITVGMDLEGPYRTWSPLLDDPLLGKTAPPGSARLDDVVNIQYTSGTTGFPKGCLLSQRYWLILAISSDAQMTVPIRRILCGQNFFYMIPHRLLLNAFLRRGTLFVPRSISASRFMPLVRDLQINYACVFEPVYKQPAHPDDGVNDLNIVHVFGLSAGNQADFERRFNVRTQEYYGMTEIGGALFMPLEETGMTGSGSCGILSPYREVRIVDEAGNDVPSGATGELLVRGPGIMYGYHNNPQASAEVFDGDWFRTGDLFRQDESGFYYIVGRLKDMIRRSGENIAAREVEAALRSFSEVKEAAVVSVPDDYHGEEIKAFIILDSSIEENVTIANNIWARCELNLAKHKIPRYLHFCENFPMTETDRVEKNKLLAMFPDNSAAYDRRALEARAPLTAAGESK